MIEVKDLTVLYGKKYVLNSVSFKLNHGHVYGIFGNRGAGKTALLDQLAGCRVPFSGTVSLNGFDPQKEAMRAKSLVGYLPQGNVSESAFTPLEFLSFVAELKDMDYERGVRKIHNLLELCGLSQKKHVLIKKLSPYEQRCIGVLQTALGSSEILLFDDPTAGLSPLEGQKILSLILSLSDNATILISGRNRAVLQDCCERVLTLSCGTLTDDGTSAAAVHS